MSGEAAIKAFVKVEDGIVITGVEFDLVHVLEDMAKATDNTVDDGLVAIITAARNNLDWKGVAKGFL